MPGGLGRMRAGVEAPHLRALRPSAYGAVTLTVSGSTYAPGGSEA